MASILFGGAGDSVESEIVSALKEHNVYYTNKSGEMLFQLLRTRSEIIPKKYDLVVCDSRLFYVGLPAVDRVARFVSDILDCLKKSDAPVVFLADADIADRIELHVKNAGFVFVAQPYVIPQPKIIPQPHCADYVVKEISTFLKK